MGENEKTIHDTLLELRTQNALLRQANVEDKAAAKERLNAEQVARARRNWVQEEAQKIEKCEGLPAKSMIKNLAALHGKCHETYPKD